jgi:hypothetical protein
MAQYRLGKWRHPKTEQIRIYLNGLDSTEEKVWFERGERRGDQLPPEFALKLCCDKPEVLTKQAVVEEIAEAFSEMDLFLDKTTWSRLGRAASW